MNRNRKTLWKKTLAVTASAAIMTTSVSALAANSYVTDNTETVMQNASSEGGGMVYNLAKPSEEEIAQLKEKYQDLYATPETAGETEYPAEYPRELLTPMTDEEIEPIVNALVKTMTFEEKLAVIADPGWGAEKVEKGQAMYLPGVPRLGVPVVRQHDGSAGVGAIYPTTNLPVENVAGNTFSTELAGKYGSVIGKELVSVGSNWELGTQFDLMRDMHWARAKDTYGEDYYLAGELATSETIGLQSQGAGAQGKHIGAYATNGDGQLWTFVDEQTLHTAYLYTFEQPIKRANLSQVMTTYTRLNGYYTFSNEYMLKDVLRDMWNWKGGVITDAMSTKEFTTILGIDSEMGKNYNTEGYVLKYMEEGLCTMEDIDTAVNHILWSMGYAGYLGLVKIDEESGLAYADSRRTIKDDGSIQYVMAGTDVSEGGDRAVIELVDSWAEDYAEGILYEEDNAIALEVAEKGIVLVKNENDTLPLTSEDYTGGNKIALVGWGADNIVPGTGTERSYGFLNYMTTPYEAMKAMAGEEAAIEAYVLDDEFGTTIPSEVIFTSEEADTNGWIMNGEETPVSEINYLTTYENNKNSIDNREDGKAFENGTENTWSGYLKAPEDGEYDLVIQSLGGSAEVTISSLDGTVIGEVAVQQQGGFPGGPGGFPGGPQQETEPPEPSDTLSASASGTLPTDGFTKDGLNASSVTATLEAGKLYKVDVTSSANSDVYDQQVKLAWITPGTEEKAEEAAIAAASEEGTTVVYFVRIGPEGHGVTVTDEDLYMYDDDLETLKELQAACEEAGNKLVVVTYNRTAFAFDGDWEENTDAILTAFYPGQAGQQAIANILLGETNPSGKLSVTMPKTYKETLLYYDPEWDTNGNGEYDEGESYDDYLAWQRFGRGGQNFKDLENEYSAQYNEGLNFGYRWYEEEGIEPQYAFGHGLSYTTFAYSDFTITLSEDEDYQFDVSVTVTNTGDVAGSEIVQIYAGAAQNVPDSVQTTKKQLVAFGRAEDLEPGESATVTMQISKRMLSYWYTDQEELTEREDGTKDKWVLATGERELMLAKSSDDIVETVTVEVTE
ncbi:MAG: glycoside hydrolase family 3 C-terminal domain-containing protein [Robinsoniella sp.]|nr:glycoside hydrolase family 3 C-terminal domain-containing protein [Robinsoniella sp.]